MSTASRTSALRSWICRKAGYDEDEDILQVVGEIILCSGASLIMLGLFGYVIYAGWFTISEIMDAMA
ncbi:hypothetical protein NN6n1_35440 [Shinella zoogloeoides]